jgi:hypothetical protein
VDHDRRLQALQDLITAHEAEHGTIADEEMATAGRSTRSRAEVVRPSRRAV